MCRIIRNDAMISFQIVSHVHHSLESRNHTSTHMSEGFINDEVIARHIICANTRMLEVVMSDQDIIHSGTLVFQVSIFESCKILASILTDHSWPVKVLYPHLYSLPSDPMNFLDSELNVASVKFGATKTG